MVEYGILLVIFGPFRSGTSLTAGMCQRLGASFGPVSDMSPAPDRYNPVGYFQRRDIVKANQTILDGSDEGLFAQGPLSPDTVGQPDIQTEALDVSWMEAHDTVAVKDPRFSFTLPYWIERNPWPGREVRLLRVRRNLDAVARSAAKHHFVSHYCDGSFDRARVLSQAMDHAAEEVCRTAPFKSHIMDYDALIDNPVRECQALAEFMGKDRKQGRKAAALVGKNNALLRHYAGKMLRPRDILDTLGKTVGARLGAR